MAETLLQFQSPVDGPGGIRYVARACGAPAPDGLWHGWIEFVPVDGGEPVESARETTQPNLRDAIYWATGLSPVYLEGALRRALEGPPGRPLAIVDVPAFDAPADSPSSTTTAGHESARHAVLDPFSVFQKGEALLRKQLTALSQWHLVNIVVEYELSDEGEDVLSRRPHAALAEIIVSGVKQHEVAGTGKGTEPHSRYGRGAPR